VTFTVVDAPVVVDASVALGVLSGEEGLEGVIRSWSRGRRYLMVPPVFWIEVANVLVRRRRLSAVDAIHDLGTLRAAGIVVADRGFGGLEAALVLADRHGLSVYDATYLWLALDVDGELATFDKALITAARAEGVELAIPA
jgi:predicted nucleic acid-binding protein